MQNLLFIGVTAHVDIQNNGAKVVNTSIHYISVNCMTALTIRQNGMFVPLVFLYSVTAHTVKVYNYKSDGV